MERIRIVVVDDHPIMRDALASYFGTEDDLEVVGRAGSGEEALQVCERTRPDVVLMDLKMPGMDGLTATRVLRSRHEDLDVVVLTTFARIDLVVDALLAGASGYLLKESRPEDILTGVRAAAAGQMTLGPEVSRAVVEAAARSRQARVSGPDPSALDLTAADREVLALLAGGLTNAEIAKELSLAESTVKTRLGHLCTKFGVRSRLQVLIRACEWGLVTPRLRQ